MTQPLRLLVVEDSEIDYQVLVATLRREGFAVESTRVELAGALQEALRTSEWDALVTDHHMPMFDALGALAILREHDPEMPAIVMSGEPAESLAVQALNAGAEDYILKGSLRRVAASLRRALRAAECRRKLAAAEEALGNSPRAAITFSGGSATLAELEGKALERGLERGVVVPLRRAGAALAEAKAPKGVSAAREDVDAALSAALALKDRLAAVDLEAGVVPALASLVSAFGSRSGLTAEFRSNRPALTLSRELALSIYRIAQDALDNVEHHGKASQVSVEVFSGSAGLTLEVTDNGTGASAKDLDPASAPGVAAMIARARLHEGTIKVSGVEGLGTTLLLTLPALQGE